MKDMAKAGFLKINAIGDTILLTAPILDLKERYPDIHLTLFTGTDNYETATLIEGVDKIIRLPLSNINETIRLIKNEGGFDFWIDFGPWPRINALLTHLARADFKIGFRTEGQYRHYIYDQAIPHSALHHEVCNYKRLLEPLSIAGSHMPRIGSSHPNMEKDLVTIQMYPGGTRSYLKEWPEENWISIIEELQKKDTSSI